MPNGAQPYGKCEIFMTENSNINDEHRYRVLARKYRPHTFDDMIGQGALVRTLSNAIASGRIAQAYMLTGVRGIGKTTTARIIAKALNHTDGPTIDVSKPCEHCDAIASDSHVDVVEMDAASHTGIDDIRELIDSVKYRPVHARYKIFILDEVHMLSKNAWNALLKTLEEPPEHVKFIFATTEIRKVPITVLSRCQRFDLRRISMDELSSHYQRICDLENVTIEADALTMIARAADGSVRDGLSILDQAIALQTDGVTADNVSDMLGLADRARIYDLVKALMAGDAPSALQILNDLHAVGADPLVVCNDVLEAIWFVTRMRLTPSLKDDPNTPEIERVAGAELAGTLSMPALSRAWQILMKGIDEIRGAPNTLQATEMVLMRMMHASTLPTPDELIKKLKSTPQPQQGQGGQNFSGGVSQNSVPSMVQSAVSPTQNQADSAQTPNAQGIEPVQNNAPQASVLLTSFRDLVQYLRDIKEPTIAMHLLHDAVCPAYTMTDSTGYIQLELQKGAPADLASRLKKILDTRTGVTWTVDAQKQALSTLNTSPPPVTLAEQIKQEEMASVDEAENDNLVIALKKHFPDAIIDKVTPTPNSILDMTSMHADTDNSNAGDNGNHENNTAVSDEMA